MYIINYLTSFYCHSLRGVPPHIFFYCHFNTILLFIEKPYTTTFIYIQRITLGSIMYIKDYFLNQCHTAMPQIIQKNKKITIINSKIKQKWKTKLGVMGNLILDFIIFFLFFVLFYFLQWRQQRVQHRYTILLLKKQVKNLLWQRIYNSNYIQKKFKIITMKNDRVNI